MHYKEKYSIWVRSKKYRRNVLFYLCLGLATLLVWGTFFLRARTAWEKAGAKGSLLVLLSLDVLCYLGTRFSVPWLVKTPDAMRKYAEQPFWWPLTHRHKSSGNNADVPQ